MEQISSLEQLQQLPAEVKRLRLGFTTNFFLDPDKHGVWIKNGDCYTEREGDTLFIIKKSPSFWNVFYCSTTKERLGDDLTVFTAKHKGITMMCDIVGREVQCKPFVDLFKEKGFKEATSLVRMMRITEPMDYEADGSIRRAKETDVPKVSQLLHSYFHEQTEQIPYDEELMVYAREGHVLVCEEKGVIAGFLIFEINASTNYLRYWFTHPDFRERKVGSRLLRRFFEEGKDTKRQLFWVIRTNENAIMRYRHYGFSEENMFDYVMQIN